MFTFSENHKFLTQGNSKHVTHCRALCQMCMSKKMNSNGADIRYYTDGKQSKEKEDHLRLTIMQLQDKASVSWVWQKSLLLNCLVNLGDGSRAELCKQRKDGLTVQLHCDEVRADSQMLVSVTVTQTTWRGVVVAEAKQEMIRNTGGKSPVETV